MSTLAYDGNGISIRFLHDGSASIHWGNPDNTHLVLSPDEWDKAFSLAKIQRARLNEAILSDVKVAILDDETLRKEIGEGGEVSQEDEVEATKKVFEALRLPHNSVVSLDQRYICTSQKWLFNLVTDDTYTSVLNWLDIQWKIGAELDDDGYLGMGFGCKITIHDYDAAKFIQDISKVWFERSVVTRREGVTSLVMPYGDWVGQLDYLARNDSGRVAFVEPNHSEKGCDGWFCSIPIYTIEKPEQQKDKVTPQEWWYVISDDKWVVSMKPCSCDTNQDCNRCPSDKAMSAAVLTKENSLALLEDTGQLVIDLDKLDDVITTSAHFKTGEFSRDIRERIEFACAAYTAVMEAPPVSVVVMYTDEEEPVRYAIVMSDAPIPETVEPKEMPIDLCENSGVRMRIRSIEREELGREFMWLNLRNIFAIKTRMTHKYGAPVTTILVSENLWKALTTTSDNAKDMKHWIDEPCAIGENPRFMDGIEVQFVSNSYMVFLMVDSNGHTMSIRDLYRQHDEMDLCTEHGQEKPI